MFKELYVLNDLLFLRIDHTKRRLVKTCIIWLFYLFLYTLSNKMAANQRSVIVFLMDEVSQYKYNSVPSY